MNIDLNRDQLVTLWRHLEKQPLTVDDQERLEALAGELFDALSDKPKRKYTLRKQQPPTNAQITEQNEEPTNGNDNNDTASPRRENQV